MGKTKKTKIEDISARQVTFSKRRQGLFKKARELSILCEAEVAAVVFSPAGRLHDYASSNIEDMLHKFSLESANKQHPVDSQDHADLSSGIQEKIKCLRMTISTHLHRWGLEELQRLETKLGAILKNVTSRKKELAMNEPPVALDQTKGLTIVHRVKLHLFSEFIALGPLSSSFSSLHLWDTACTILLSDRRENGKEYTTSIRPAEMGPGDEETGCSC